MAGQGFAPKDPSQRAGTAVPKRGEWESIPRENLEPAPELPARESGWSERTRLAWRAWWRDPASTQWTPADRDNVLYLAELFDLGSVTIANELRLRMDGLGLTQKGKRDLRWRIEETPTEVAPARKKRASSLHLVDDAVSA